jgi:hypothetical protein
MTDYGLPAVRTGAICIRVNSEGKPLGACDLRKPGIVENGGKRVFGCGDERVVTGTSDAGSVCKEIEN